MAVASSSSKKQQEEEPAKKPSVMDNLWELIEGDVMDQSGHQRVISKSKGRKKKTKEKSALIDIRKKSKYKLNKIKTSSKLTKDQKNG